MKAKRKSNGEKAACAALIFFAHVNGAYCDVKLDLETIQHIESGGNPRAVSKAGARGLYQIMPVVLQEYNKMTGSSFTTDDLFNPDVNEQIAVWYLAKRIPKMLKHYKLPVTVENILWAYNAGIGNVVKGRLPAETKRYLQKYITEAGTL
jgi:soluble lytic murein transglycosylase-like protein